MTIPISTDAKAIIDAAVASGQFASPEAVVDAGLRLLAVHDRKVAELRASIQAAIERGGSFTDEEVEAAIEAELDVWEQDSERKTRAAE